MKRRKKSINFACDNQITTNVCTGHDSTAVMAHAKFCSDQFATIWITAKWNSHQIWIASEKSSVIQTLRPPAWTSPLKTQLLYLHRYFCIKDTTKAFDTIDNTFKYAQQHIPENVCTNFFINHMQLIWFSFFSTCDIMVQTLRMYELIIIIG